MTTRIETWAFVSLLGALVGAVHCGGDEAETSAPAAAGSGGAAGKAGSAGSGAGAAGKGGAAGSAAAGSAGAAGTTAGSSGAGAGGSSGASAGAGGAGAAGAGGGAAGTSGGGAAGSNSGGAAGTSSAGAAGASGGTAGSSTGGAGGETAGSGGSTSAGGGGGSAGAGGSEGGAAGAAGTGGAGGEPGYPFFDDPRNTMWLESDRFTKPPASDAFKVEKWLDQGNYVSAAEVGLFAADSASFPKLVNVGPTTVHQAIGLENNGFAFHGYGSVLQKLDAGYSLFVHLDVTADPVSFEAFFDCGTKAETAHLSSLEHRIYLGRNQSNGLQYSVFDGAGQMKGTVGKADVFTSSSSFVTIGVTHFPEKALLYVNGVEVGSAAVPMPDKTTRGKCFIGRSLLRNRPDNHDMVGSMRAVYGFSSALGPADITLLQTYITQRWTP